MLYGDVTGNWQPDAAASVAETSALSFEERAAIATDTPLRAVASRDPHLGTATISADPIGPALHPGQRREIVLRMENADGILGLDLTLPPVCRRSRARQILRVTVEARTTRGRAIRLDARANEGSIPGR